MSVDLPLIFAGTVALVAIIGCGWLAIALAEARGELEDALEEVGELRAEKARRMAPLIAANARRKAAANARASN
jgi:polyhydroxyalkanoate synthesis regulator phasin